MYSNTRQVSQLHHLHLKAYRSKWVAMLHTTVVLVLYLISTTIVSIMVVNKIDEVVR